VQSDERRASLPELRDRLSTLIHQINNAAHNNRDRFTSPRLPSLPRPGPAHACTAAGRSTDRSMQDRTSWTSGTSVFE
jgi:hypothetical protein